MKNKNNIIFIGVSLIILIAIVIISPMATKDTSTKENKADEELSLYTRASNESKNIKEDERKAFNDISVDTFLVLLHNEEKSIVLIGREGCEYCKIAEPIIQNIMYKYNLDINYISTDYFTEESYQKFSSSNDLLKSFATPFLMIVSNGEIINYAQGLQDSKSYTSFLSINGFIEE